MKNLFESSSAAELKARLSHLGTGSTREWGSMTPGQAVAHCSISLEMALGDVKPPRVLLGRLMGRIIKPLVLKNEDPFRRNSPTAKDLVVEDDRDLNAERIRLRTLIDRFSSAGPKGCTAHPHAFFGPLTPNEWAILMYKHLDHHLRQFGV